MGSGETEAQSGQGSLGKGKHLSTILLMFAGAILGGFITYDECYSSRSNAGWFTAGTAVLTGSGLSAIAAPVAWKLGHFLGQLAQPDLIFTTGAADLAKKRIGFSLLPLGLAALAALLSVFGVASFAESRCTVLGEAAPVGATAPSKENERSTSPNSPAPEMPHSNSSPQTLSPQPRD